MNDSTYHKTLLGVGIAALVVSGVMALDKFTWVLEVTPAVVGWIILIATYKKFKFSSLVYTLILLHSFILMYGGIYTYAETPLGYWMSEVFGWTRNNYDKIGHFAQGFVPALLAREVLLRLQVINEKRKKWLTWIIVSLILASAAFFEWWVSLASGSAGDSFLGTQGYVWDTQTDMFLALVGAVLALVLFSRFQDRFLNSLWGK